MGGEKLARLRRPVALVKVNATNSARGASSVSTSLPTCVVHIFQLCLTRDGTCPVSLCAQAGGTVTDLEGAPLNFSSEAAKGDGARLSKHVVGIVATSGAGGASSSSGVHAKVLAALREARRSL